MEASYQLQYSGYSTPRERASRTDSTAWWAQMVWMFWKKAKYPAPAVELTTVLWLLSPKPCHSTDYRIILSACYISPTKMYHIYSNARSGFALNFSAHLCGVILNLCRKCRTGLHHVGSLCNSPFEDKPRPALANLHV
jgi:hypothetical protein